MSDDAATTSGAAVAASEVNVAAPAAAPASADEPTTAAADAPASPAAATTGAVTTDADEHKDEFNHQSGAAATPAFLPGAPGAAAINERWRALSKTASGQGNPDGVELAWKDITLEAGSKKILRGLSGVIRPGALTAIMGPSGAGKSSLLNILAGRTRSGGKITVGGTVTANHVPVDPVRFRKRIAYVMQEDALFATQTPREALTFSAALRLPVSVTEAERTQLVENIIQALGLSKCADTLIGSHMIPGISGGEKKRTAIGVELVSSPDILFLDEPTSGLDSFAAFQVVQILKNLAASGRTVVTTIHQPSSEVFESFTDVLLLADGRLVYHSPVAEMTNYFASVGQRRAGDVDPKQFICRPNYNPADFVMFMMQQQTAEGIEVLAQEWAHEVKTAALEGGRGRACSGASLSMEASKSARERYESILNTNEKKPGFCTQFKYLATREVLGVLRDKGSMGARIGSTIFLNIIVAMVFFQAADWSDVDGSSQAEVITQVNAQFGVLVQLGIGGMFGLAQPTMLTFPLERPVFLREYASGSYGAVPYFLSKLMSEVPTTIMQSALMWLCTYWLCGLEGNFFVLVLTVALLGLVAASTSLLIGAIAESVQVAMQLTPLLFVPQLLFAGFFIPISQIPVWLRWAQYLCSLKYSLNLLVIVEFDRFPSSWPSEYAADAFRYFNAVYGCSGADLVDSECVESARVGPDYNSALLPRSEIVVDDAYKYLLVLLFVLVFFRCLALFALVGKARHR